MLELKNISKTFGMGTVNQKLAIDNLSLHLNKGDFVTIIGGNGAGKSTLFGAIAGSFICEEGNVILDGEDITMQKEYKRARYIGRLFQDPLWGTSPNMTIEENLSLAMKGGGMSLSFGIKKNEVALFREKLKMLDLGLEDRMKTKVGLLSGGQRQAVTLLMSTIVTPKLLLLDEHTAALDPGTADKVLKLTKQIVENKNITTMMITHNIDSALKLGNRTIMMNSGKVVLDIKGKEREKMTTSKLISMFGVNTDRMVLGD